MHSKTIQLGVIVLALRLLGKFHLPVPRILSTVALLLGVSRKAGYEAATRIEKLLSGEGQSQRGEDFEREVLRLRIQNQVLTYERDHPGVRFRERGCHLPGEAKSLCVRILRDFREELSESEIASLVGVSLTSLRRWHDEADADGNFPSKPDDRGQHSRANAEDVRQVLAEFKKLKEEGTSLTLEAFTEHYKRAYPHKPLDRRTITRILQAEGLLEVKTRSSPKPYHDQFEIYIPGAQVAVDATKAKVRFIAGEPETIIMSKEVALDVATCAVLGEALEVNENSDGVQRALVQARQECVSLLAVLSDNGPANRAEKTRACVERVSAVGQVFSFPYRPQTNGHLEGFFGQFSRVVGTIEIDDSSRETIARSVVEVIYRIYFHFHNHSPRKRLGDLAPMEYFRRYSSAPREKVEEARRGLHRQRERAAARRYPPERLCDPRFRSLVAGVLERNRIEKPLDEALKALLHYDNQAIESSSEAFYSYSQRDSFQEQKRTFSYFMGIVRKKQTEIDEARKREEAQALQARRFHQEQKEQQREVQREKAQEEEDLRREPERVVLQYAELLLTGGLRFKPRAFLESLRRGLKALIELGRPRRVIEQLALTIRSWAKYSEQLKDEMVEILRTEFQALVARGYHDSAG